jgi:transposase
MNSEKKKNSLKRRVARNQLILFLNDEGLLPLANIAEEAQVCVATVKSVIKNKGRLLVEDFGSIEKLRATENKLRARKILRRLAEEKWMTSNQFKDVLRQDFGITRSSSWVTKTLHEEGFSWRRQNFI